MRGSFRPALVAVVAAFAAAACATRTPEPSAPAGGWRSAHGRAHPLAGRIVETASGRTLEPEALFDRLAAVELVLLGERHDNADHHLLEARVIDALVARGRRPAVAFEMLAEDEGPALAAARGSGPEAIRAAVRWDASGWPPWPLYAPVFEAALRAGLPLRAANLSRRDAAALRGHGLGGLDADTRVRLGLDAPAPAAELQALAQQIYDAHCGHAPPALLLRMAAMQRAWNARLADALLAARAEGRGGAVLVAGAQHVRRDWGAPAWIARRAPDVSLVSVAFVEVEPEAPACALRPAPRGAAPFDYLWYTPRVDLEDPCAKYREPLERMAR